MFQNFKTLGMILVVSITLVACADLAYLLSGDDGQKQSNTQTRTQQVDVVESQPKNFLPQRDERPISTVQSNRSVYDAAQCLIQHIADDFNLPSDFYAAQGYDDGAATVLLVNPTTGKSGLYIDIVPINNGSQLSLYQNRATISNAWKRLPEKCR